MLLRLATRRLVTAYDLALGKFPLRTKAASAACISATGDTLLQLATADAASPLDRLRTLRQVLWSVGSSPLVHLEYQLLSTVRPLLFMPAPVVAVVISQACFSPLIFYLYLFGTTIGGLYSVRAIPSRLLPRRTTGLLTPCACVRVCACVH